MYTADLSDNRNETTGIGEMTNTRVDQIRKGGICNVTWSLPQGSSENKVTKYVVNKI